ncbi:hypothetical protein Q5752_000679 [Cryptotrichosporon argae]
METPAPTAPEPRARRTHARRSCDLCKMRKTRCELPDLDVPAGASALPADKACHRCRVLALPCVVNDKGAKSKRKREDGSEEGLGKKADKPRRKKDGSAPGQASMPKSGTATPVANPVDHSYDLFHGFEAVPSSSGPATLATLGIASLAPAPFKAAMALDAAGTTSIKAASIRLHGRPLELVSLMLHIAHGNDPRHTGRNNAIVLDDVDLAELVPDDLRDKLDVGFAQLRTYHPHLQSLRRLFGQYATQRSPALSLLLSICLYLSALTLPSDERTSRLRAVLAPHVAQLQAHVVLRLPATVPAMQALELLAFHAPFGSLPFTLTDTRALAPARGHVVALDAIAVALRFPQMVANFNAYHNWANEDYWLWLGVVAAEAHVALEDDRVVRPARLAEASKAVDMLTRPGFDEFWKTAVENGTDQAEVFGRLAMCDRLLRLDEVHVALTKLRDTLETAASVDGFDVVAAISAEHEHFLQRMDAIDKRHAELTALLDFPRALTSGWTAYRKIRRKFEVSRVLVIGLHMLMACQYLPAVPFAFANLPTHASPAQAVVYALNRSYNPEDMMAVIQSETPASDALRFWGRRRGEVAERVLIAFAELASGATATQPAGPRRHADLVPLHETSAVAVECAKVLMEMQAGSVIALRSIGAVRRAFKTPTWVHVMREIAGAMRTLANRCVDDGGGGQSVVNGCSNLLGSMCRTADEWARHVDVEARGERATSVGAGSAPPDGAAQSNAVSSTASPSLGALTADREQLMRGYGAVPRAPGSNLGQHIVVADRWMADDPPVSAGPATYAAAAARSPRPAYPFAPGVAVSSERERNAANGASGSAKGPGPGAADAMHLHAHTGPAYVPSQTMDRGPYDPALFGPTPSQAALGGVGPVVAADPAPYPIQMYAAAPVSPNLLAPPYAQRTDGMHIGSAAPPLVPVDGQQHFAPPPPPQGPYPPQPVNTNATAQESFNAVDQLLSEAFGYGGYAAARGYAGK